MKCRMSVCDAEFVVVAVCIVVTCTVSVIVSAYRLWTVALYWMYIGHLLMYLHCL